MPALLAAGVYTALLRLFPCSSSPSRPEFLPRGLLSPSWERPGLAGSSVWQEPSRKEHKAPRTNHAFHTLERGQGAAFASRVSSTLCSSVPARSVSEHESLGERNPRAAERQVQTLSLEDPDYRSDKMRHFKGRTYETKSKIFKNRSYEKPLAGVLRERSRVTPTRLPINDDRETNHTQPMMKNLSG